MPQMLLPIFPAGVNEINDKLAFKKEDGVVTYFSATMPVPTLSNRHCLVQDDSKPVLCIGDG